jgi:hypothetical protein
LWLKVGYRVTEFRHPRFVASVHARVFTLSIAHYSPLPKPLDAL